MGGQQFLEDGSLLLDLSALSAVTAFDNHLGILEVQAGAQWPHIIETTRRLQPESESGPAWAIRQKQTGADTMSLGGSIAAMFTAGGCDSDPSLRTSRTSRSSTPRARSCGARGAELGAVPLVVGGYGLFGVVVAATLRGYHGLLAPPPAGERPGHRRGCPRRVPAQRKVAWTAFSSTPSIRKMTRFLAGG